jgi:hypothetical protein
MMFIQYSYQATRLLRDFSTRGEGKMISRSISLAKQPTETEVVEKQWKSFYRVGGVAALLTVVVVISEILITFLPGGSTPPESVIDWFALFQNNWFLGLRNLGLLNIAFTTLAIPVFFALYESQRRFSKSYATLALIIFIVGEAVFYATNRAFPMLDLSRQYAAATTDSQRAMIVAAGQAMLAVGQSHTPGTFLGFFFSEVAGLLISIVMLQSGVFSKATAYVGMLGFGLLLIFEICSSFVPALFDLAMIFAMGGGLLEMVWYILVGRRLFQLGRGISTGEVYQDRTM